MIFERASIYVSGINKHATDIKVLRIRGSHRVQTRVPYRRRCYGWRTIYRLEYSHGTTVKSCWEKELR